MISNTAKGYAAASLAALIIGFSFMFVKLALAESTATAILADRFTIAFIAMLPIAFLKRKNITISSKKLVLFLPIAILYPVLFFSMQTFGMEQAITSSEAGIVQSTTPIFIALLAFVFLKEQITPLQLFFTVLSVSGVLTILFANGAAINLSHATGLLFILLSVLSSAVNNILIRKHRNAFSTLEVTFFSTLLGFIVFNGMHIATSYINGAPYLSFIQSKNTLYILAILYLGVLSSLCSSFFTNYALSKIPSSKVGMFGNLVIVFAILGGTLFMDEQPTALQLTGALLIILSVAGANIAGTKKG